MALRQLHLGAFMRPTTIHTASWRYPGAYPDANFNLSHLKQFIQTLERGKFDAFFMADHLAVLNMPMNALRRSHTVTSFEPFTLLSALAMVTDHIGLIATGSTSFDAPFHVARRFASLDHISGGRAAWNIVTTSNPDAALNFGLEEPSSTTNAIAAPASSMTSSPVSGTVWPRTPSSAMSRPGVFRSRPHARPRPQGRIHNVRGPLDIARPVQGWPVIVQAGGSEAGRQLAAETAEVIFASGSSLVEAQRFYADVKSRAKKAGRSSDHLKILPGALVVVGETIEEAKREASAARQSRPSDSGLASLSIALGCDASGFDLDGPLPEIPETNASKSGRERFVSLARRDNLTVRQLAQIAGSFGGLSFVGTASTIADQMEEWLLADSCDGFNVMFPYVPGGLDDFVDTVIPELQRRGLFRREYEGKTLRENLGLPRPKNRFFS